MERRDIPYIDSNLDGGSGLWARAEDGKFWLEGDSDDDDDLDNVPPHKRTSKIKKSADAGERPGEGEEEGDSSDSDLDLPFMEDLDTKKKKQGRKNESDDKFERRWQARFQALYEQLPRRPKGIPIVLTRIRSMLCLHVLRLFH